MFQFEIYKQNFWRMSASLLAVLGSFLLGCTKTENLHDVQVGSFAAPPDVVAIKLSKYVPQQGNGFQHLYVSNFSVKVENNQLALSTSRDSLSDSMKQQLAADYGFTVGSAESAVRFFADLLLFSLGVKLPQQYLLHCSSNLALSTSNDALIYTDTRQAGSPQEFLGLRDCEKTYMGLNPKTFDYSGNGIPDYLKLRCGLNPLNKNDAYVSTAGDGVANIDKCKRNVPIDQNFFSQPSQTFAYQYSSQVSADGTMEFDINNIPILNGGADNFIAFYFVESDLTTNAETLTSAFTILKGGMSGKTLAIDYWGTSANNLLNQEISLP
ncbi:MAG: hypothetical protein C5B49_11630 [Bdellovibrio sp.]|nr:MAG: hypothetical protein C5B49_11630 [Bdellovibrio sp.]